jgi:hypothetical protein
MILTGFNTVSSYMYIKYIDRIHPPLLSPFILLFPLVPFPQQDLFYIPFLHYLSVYSFFKKVLPWHFTSEYVVSDHSSPSIILPYPFHSNLYYLIAFFLHKCNVFILFSSPSLPLHSPQTVPVFETHTHIYIQSCLYLYMCFFNLSSTYKRKHATFVFLNLAYFT